jgi:hypothetical protein
VPARDLCNSIYRFDNDMIVNTHVYGILAAYTPALHLRRIDGAYMLRILDANPAAFDVEIAGKDRSKGPVAPVAGVMRMLWDGQTSDTAASNPRGKRRVKRLKWQCSSRPCWCSGSRLAWCGGSSRARQLLTAHHQLLSVCRWLRFAHDPSTPPHGRPSTRNR